MTPTILSIPGSGTRFFWFFVERVCGVQCQWLHFRWSNKSGLAWYLDTQKDTVFIVPVRDREKSVRSLGDREWAEKEFFAVADALWPKLVEYGAHFIDVEKTDKSEQQLRSLVKSLGLGWTPRMQQFVYEWPVIGKRDCSSELDTNILDHLPPERFIRLPKIAVDCTTNEIE